MLGWIVAVLVFVYTWWTRVRSISGTIVVTQCDRTTQWGKGLGWITPLTPLGHPIQAYLVQPDPPHGWFHRWDEVVIADFPATIQVYT